METYSISKVQSWLIWFLKGVLVLAGLILIGRLFEIQVIKGEYFRKLSDGNRIRRVPLTAPRGRILSSNGEVIVDSKEVNKVIVFDQEKGYVKLDAENDSPEEDVVTEWERDYLLGSAASHLTGYIGEVSEDELGKVDAKCPEKGPRLSGQKIGRAGLEEKYDCILKGVPGEEMVEVDSTGMKLNVLGIRESISGNDIRTTINSELQKRVSFLMKDVEGAAIVINPKGEVLAISSSPSYDPNFFVGKNQENIRNLLDNEDLPLFNRVISGSFPPGSVFKPIVAIAGLEEGDIDGDYTYTDTGVVEVNTDEGNFTYRNWYFTQYGGTEGEIGIEKALARSTDTFFYKLGEALGPGNLLKWSNIFGLNESSGIDIPGEILGLIPSPGWKQEVKGERWFLGNTYHMSIGQGDLLLTPIALNRAIAAIAADGKLCDVKIIDTESNSREVLDLIEIEESENCSELEVSQKSIDLVTEGMIEACSSGGTGFTFFEINQKADENEEFLLEKTASGENKIEAHKVACKTGTAETGKESEPHAWFTFFAPAEDPEIVVTVLVENGGEGSRVAGPIAREIYDQWFKVD